MKHWILVVSLLLLLPIEGSGQGLSDSRLDLQRVASADSCFDELLKEKSHQEEESDSDGLLSSFSLALSQQSFAVSDSSVVAAAQTLRITPPIRAPPHFI
ncbi:hypothetical protein HHX48_07540 [Salinimonas sp. HHU 13199]|uniref:Uncharacterized protein n=1 Tax=Salinimonas profundi TaxID=2729140 RepID=A0ABR8LMG4_9ALTE|nr:hypothetical protein [Salinimonas profundi]MBD3585582.1 hypothetical protein [Salinimonas profundi]